MWVQVWTPASQQDLSVGVGNLRDFSEEGFCLDRFLWPGSPEVPPEKPFFFRVVSGPLQGARGQAVVAWAHCPPARQETALGARIVGFEQSTDRRAWDEHIVRSGPAG